MEAPFLANAGVLCPQATLLRSRSGSSFFLSEPHAGVLQGLSTWYDERYAEQAASSLQAAEATAAIEEELLQAMDRNNFMEEQLEMFARQSDRMCESVRHSKRLVGAELTEELRLRDGEAQVWASLPMRGEIEETERQIVDLSAHWSVMQDRERKLLAESRRVAEALGKSAERRDEVQRQLTDSREQAARTILQLQAVKSLCDLAEDEAFDDRNALVSILDRCEDSLALACQTHSYQGSDLQTLVDELGETSPLCTLLPLMKELRSSRMSIASTEDRSSMGRPSNETVGAESSGPASSAASGHLLTLPPSAPVSTTGLQSQEVIPHKSSAAASDEDGLRAQIQELTEKNRALQMELDEEKQEFGASQDHAKQMNMREGELRTQTCTLEDRVELLAKECSELREEVQEFEDSLPPLQQDLQEVSTKLGAERAKKVAQAIELAERRASASRFEQSVSPPSCLRMSPAAPQQLRRALADAYEQLALLAQQKTGPAVDCKGL